MSEAALMRRRDLDEQVLRRLAEAGSDLTKPHSIEHHFVCSERSSATPVLSFGASAGYQPSPVAENTFAGQPHFTFDLVRVCVPTLAAITEQTRAMMEIATKHGLEYDGWGCMVVE